MYCGSYPWVGRQIDTCFTRLFTSIWVGRRSIDFTVWRVGAFLYSLAYLLTYLDGELVDGHDEVGEDFGPEHAREAAQRREALHEADDDLEDGRDLPRRAGRQSRQ